MAKAYDLDVLARVLTRSVRRHLRQRIRQDTKTLKGATVKKYRTRLADPAYQRKCMLNADVALAYMEAVGDN